MQATRPLIPLLSAVFLAMLAQAGVTRAAASLEGATSASDKIIAELRTTRPEFAALSKADQSTLYLWLNASCANGAGTTRDSLQALGTRAERALIEAFQMGPPVAQLDDQAESRRAQFDSIQEELKGEGYEWLDPKLRSKLQARSQEDYVNEGIAATIQSYRLAALRGLAVSGSGLARSWLERTAPKIKDPALSQAAEETLRSISRR